MRNRVLERISIRVEFRKRILVRDDGFLQGTVAFQKFSVQMEGGA